MLAFSSSPAKDAKRQFRTRKPRDFGPFIGSPMFFKNDNPERKGRLMKGIRFRGNRYQLRMRGLSPRHKGGRQTNYVGSYTTLEEAVLAREELKIFQKRAGKVGRPPLAMKDPNIPLPKPNGIPAPSTPKRSISAPIPNRPPPIQPRPLIPENKTVLTPPYPMFKSSFVSPIPQIFSSSPPMDPRPNWILDGLVDPIEQLDYINEENEDLLFQIDGKESPIRPVILFSPTK